MAAWNRVTPGGEPAAQAHPLIAQDIQVQVGVAFELVTRCLPIADALTRQFPAAGVFGDDLPVTGDADQQTKLLALAGRRP